MDSLARHKRVGCGATVTIYRHRRLANLLVVEPGGSNPGLAQKLNRRSRRLKFWRAQKDSNRTLNLLIRSQMLYPIEPWAQRSYILYVFIQIARKNIFIFIFRRGRCVRCHDKTY